MFSSRAAALQQSLAEASEMAERWNWMDVTRRPI
jgi:hypothetical protein